ncbi:hypothetical protein XELAEV_18038074mg [Xenopus laevis]|uniref:Uncharacterized protein n=1 Tax=Xenopus laevis TaxID=8355 RepID=A0A974CDF0_XENLA|nr:hypothetical protein XELAEV_18038074mg [Xenopus laevis]
MLPFLSSVPLQKKQEKPRLTLHVGELVYRPKHHSAKHCLCQLPLRCHSAIHIEFLCCYPRTPLYTNLARVQILHVTGITLAANSTLSLSLSTGIAAKTLFNSFAL